VLSTEFAQRIARQRMQKRMIIGAAMLLAATALGSGRGFADDNPVVTAPIPPPLPKVEAPAPVNMPTSPPAVQSPSPAPTATPSNPVQISNGLAKSRQKTAAAKKAAARKMANRHHNPARQVAKEVAQEGRDAERRNPAAARPHPPRQEFAGGPPGYPGPGYDRYDVAPPVPYSPPWYGRGYAYAPPYPGMRPPAW
jgi:hypothetical protein